MLTLPEGFNFETGTVAVSGDVIVYAGEVRGCDASRR